MSARRPDPDDAFAIDVHAARRIGGHRLAIFHRQLVVLRQRRLRWIRARNEARDGAREARHRAPDRTVNRTWSHAVVWRADPFVLGGIDRLIRLHVRVALAVAVRVEDERRPSLRLLLVTGLV